MRVGVLFIGLRGATASTVVGTVAQATERDRARFLLSEEIAQAGVPLAGCEDLAFGGWDTFRESWAQTFERHGVLHGEQRAAAVRAAERAIELPALALAEDHPAMTGEAGAGVAGREALVRLREDIRGFRRQVEADLLVVVNLGGPARLPPASRWPRDAASFVEALERGVFRSSAPYYFAAAILEGAAVVDYTASETLEIPGLVALAEENRVPLAGRDGSTGQTLQKSVLAAMFRARRLDVEGWYSTNILGNHDGLVLQDERFVDVKRRDKTDLLDVILGYEVKSHLVDIRYFAPHGDNKEAWDAVELRGWCGSRARVRIDWHGSDSMLAAPAIVDLVRLMAHARHSGARGLQTHLGVFFKHALGTEERRFLSLHRKLLEHYSIPLP